ncbi:hypothetical protein FUA48_12580 [Flavobacterium alkalisoli]|uniref:Beta-lactamase-inhibitor-like PepSY-like domain-containing protein n=1 Tax=Flavobacterium alkalisoli TaxID=2602769 RepID=A0A5B9FU40_9FLAO|nr:hypothetical protein [Flavobacterium alkalisoli]QEE50384.1 hypothetical protein FUA48_12580 [Flavobacterium alkalisoli]
MKNLFLSAALVLAFAANAVTVNQIRTSENTTVNYQEKEYKVIEQGDIAPAVLKSAVDKYAGYALVNAYVAQDGSDYKFVLTKDGKDITAYFKNSGEFIKEETA